MNISVANEARIFGASFLCGILGGVIFDIFRALRIKVKSGTALVALEDILFWLALSGVVFAFMYRVNNGQPRWYIFVGIILGAIIYRLTVSRYIVAAFKKIFDLLCAFFKILQKIFIFPFKILKRPFKILVIPLSKFAKKIKFLTQKSKNNIKKMKKVAKMY